MHQPCPAFPNARHGAHTSQPLPLVHNTVSAPNARRERERWSAQLAALQAGVERAQRVAADARAEAGRAGAAAQRCEAELGNARKQATALRERVKDLEQQQRARAPPSPPPLADCEPAVALRKRAGDLGRRPRACPPAPPPPAARDVSTCSALGSPAGRLCYQRMPSRDPSDSATLRPARRTLPTLVASLRAPHATDLSSCACGWWCRAPVRLGARPAQPR
jgi:hypothetical protein